MFTFATTYRRLRAMPGPRVDEQLLEANATIPHSPLVVRASTAKLATMSHEESAPKRRVWGYMDREKVSERSDQERGQADGQAGGERDRESERARERARARARERESDREKRERARARAREREREREEAGESKTESSTESKQQSKSCVWVGGSVSQCRRFNRWR